MPAGRRTQTNQKHMPISQSDSIGLTCPACGAHFETEAWTLVDAAERSDLAQALRDGSLNMATCPKCGTQTVASAALLFHDPGGRRVYFAGPPDIGEYARRERAQEMLRQLVDSLPPDGGRPYLGDVQVEQELDGVRRAVLRHDRRRAGRQGGKETGKQGEGETARPIVVATESMPHPASTNSQLPVPNSQPLIETLRALLAAD